MLSARTWDAWYASSLGKARQPLCASHLCDSHAMQLIDCVCTLVLLQKGVLGMLQAPWNVNENKFKSPATACRLASCRWVESGGQGVRGPAPLVRH